MRAHLSSTLALVADSEIEPAALERIRALQDEGATVVAWEHSRIVQDRFPSPQVAKALAGAGIEARALTELLGPEEDFQVDDAVIQWMKAFGRRPLGGGASFRGRFRYHGLVLWWWAELYLYHETPLRLAVRDIEVLARLVEARRPARIVVVHPRRALEPAARSLVGEVEVVGRRRKGPPHRWKTTALFLGDLAKMMGSGLKSLLRRPPPPVAGAPRVFFLTHASMWRERPEPDTGREELFEFYFDGILPEVARRAATIVVAFGPPVPFKKRKPLAVVADLLELGEKTLPYRPIRRYFRFSTSLRLVVDFLQCLGEWRRFRRLPGLEEDVSHRAVFLGPEALSCFRDTFLRQFPWTIRSYREVEGVLLRERPDVLVLYAESSGLGRAAVAAGRRHRVPSFAVQHGIMYPQYYSHEHAADEIETDPADSVPIPARTAVFGSLAKELLVERGHYPEGCVVVTGSPKFDALVSTAKGFDPKLTRERLGVPAEASCLVLASRFTAVGPVFAELVDAVERLDDVWLLVKPHQAESPRPYREILGERSSGRTRMLSSEENLLELLVASDGLITVDSLASSEALVLGRLVLVVNLPSNLAPLVERGVALGVFRGESVIEALEKLLFDRDVATRLEARRKEYIQEFAFGADGRSTERIVEGILETAAQQSR